MQWYHYFSGLWAGAFIANFVPHFVKGICGDAFPTPFANPPGKGLSSPMVNVLWSLPNIIVGYLLFNYAKISPGNILSLIIFFIGFAAFSVMMGSRFTHKHKG